MPRTKVTPASVARSRSSALETPSDSRPRGSTRPRAGSRSPARRARPRARRASRPAGPRRIPRTRSRFGSKPPRRTARARSPAAAAAARCTSRPRGRRTRRESPPGTTNQPTRSPGATVFENEEVKVTRSPPSSSWSDGARCPRSGRARRGRPRGRRARAPGRARRRAGDALAERSAARVLEGRDRVEERDVAAARELRLERVGVEPLVVHLDGDDLDALPAEELQRPIVGRPFDEDAPGSARELRGGVEDEALQPARREEDPAGVDPVTLPEQLSQRPVAPTRAIGEDRPTVTLERLAGAVREQLGVEAGGEGAPRANEIGAIASSLRLADPTATVLPNGRPPGSAREIRFVRLRVGSKVVGLEPVPPQHRSHMQTKSFAALGVSAELAAALDARGIVSPFEIQTRAIPPALAGTDLLAKSPTGSGKTLAFAIPLVERVTAGRRTSCRARPRPDARARAPGDRGDRVSRRRARPRSRPSTAASPSGRRRTSPATRTSSSPRPAGCRIWSTAG